MANLEWTVRPAEPENAKLLARVHAESFLAAYASDDPGQMGLVNHEAHAFLTPERIERRKELILRAHANDDERYYEAVDQHEAPIGFLYGWKNNDSQELNALYVSPNYFGKGVARDLTQIFLKWCDPEQLVTLGVVRDNFRAQRFYQKMGFVAITKPREPYYSFLPEITMIKQPGEQR